VTLVRDRGTLHTLDAWAARRARAAVARLAGSLGPGRRRVGKTWNLRTTWPGFAAGLDRSPHLGRWER
jgi:hypothetical protein